MGMVAALYRRLAKACEPQVVVELPCPKLGLEQSGIHLLPA